MLGEAFSSVELFAAFLILSKTQGGGVVTNDGVFPASVHSLTHKLYPRIQLARTEFSFQLEVNC